MLDVFLAQRAQQPELGGGGGGGKRLHAIETTDEQCNPLAALTMDQVG
jgi:hypothetical protein